MRTDNPIEALAARRSGAVRLQGGGPDLGADNHLPARSDHQIEPDTHSRPYPNNDEASSVAADASRQRRKQISRELCHNMTADLTMATTLDLDRTWTLADATTTLSTCGISLKSEAGGYRVNFATGGTIQTEYVTDDLIGALVTGFGMAEHPSAPSAKLRRARRRFHRVFRIGRYGKLSKRPNRRS